MRRRMAGTLSPGETGAGPPPAVARVERSAPAAAPTGAQLLVVRDLVVTIATPRHGLIHAVRGIDLDLVPGEVLGIVGESGSGKTIVVKTIMGVTRAYPGVKITGSIRLLGRELVGIPDSELKRIQGRRISMIFQDPMSSLDPLMQVGQQVQEVLRAHGDMTKQEARQRVVQVLREVEIPDVERRRRWYPHQFSGGMRQRVMIAMALACEPAIVIADEPTTALDVTTQANILGLLDRLRRQHGSSVIFVTHDLDLLARLADRVMVMYAGQCVEVGGISDIYHRPGHPYKMALLGALPSSRAPGERLLAIEGAPPRLDRPPKGCAFAQRCPFVKEQCQSEVPPLEEKYPGHKVRCWLDSEEREVAWKKSVSNRTVGPQPSGRGPT